MKKIVTLFFSLIVGLCTLVQAQVDVNPVNVARAFALRTPVSYNCYLYGSVVESNTTKSVNMRFTMTKDMAITNLTVNDVAVPLSEPIYGFPLGKDGTLWNVSLNVSAMTEGGEYAGSGYVSKRLVTKDDLLEIKLAPAPIKIEIPYDVEKYGQDVSIEIEGANNYNYGWGVTYNALYLYLSPVGGSYKYVLRSALGDVIGSGTVEPFKGVKTPNNGYVDIGYVGNVVGIDFEVEPGYEGWAYCQTDFDCDIPTSDGNTVKGKVFFMDCDVGGLDVYSSSSNWIYIQGASSEDGNMPTFATTETSNDQYSRVWSNDKKLGKVVVIIIPKSSVSNSYLNFHRYYGLPNDGVGGKG